MARVIPYAALQYTAHEQWKKTLRVETREERRKRPFMGFVAGSLTIQFINGLFPGPQLSTMALQRLNARA